MAKPALVGSHTLDNDSIDAAITKTSAGAYALGRSSDDSKTFYISYVGRADSDVKGRLKKHVGSYKRFMYQYCTSPKDAFETECELYHKFSPPDNKIHPDRPKDANWKCPNCKNFG